MNQETWKDKVKGMFLGIAIGDALGMPLETMTGEQIKKRFGRITNYIRPDGHKWFDGWEAGRWTDDTQLTLVIAQSLIEKGKIDLDDIAERHVAAMDECSLGWGKSTKESITRIKSGEHWSETGKPGGSGNGVAMKISPIGLYSFFGYINGFEAYLNDLDMSKYGWQTEYYHFNENVINLTLATHQSNMALASAFSQIEAVLACSIFNSSANHSETTEDLFLRGIIMGSVFGENCDIHLVDIPEVRDKLSSRILSINQMIRFQTLINVDAEWLAEFFGGATCYVYNSLPFCYAMFLRNPYSIETLFDTVNAGGDTDTNGSIIGALIGVLNGTSIFPQQLVDGLWQKDEIISVAERFAAKFPVE